MTQPEFEALQVGDVVKWSDYLAVVYEVRGKDKYAVHVTNGTIATIRADKIHAWHVVSRVLSRENVNPVKGGAK